MQPNLKFVENIKFQLKFVISGTNIPNNFHIKCCLCYVTVTNPGFIEKINESKINAIHSNNRGQCWMYILKVKVEVYLVEEF